MRALSQTLCEGLREKNTRNSVRYEDVARVFGAGLIKGVRHEREPCYDDRVRGREGKGRERMGWEGLGKEMEGKGCGVEVPAL